MASHRYESRFRFCAALYNTSTNSFLQKSSVGTSSSNNASTAPKATTGLPASGYAYYGAYNNYWLIAQNSHNSLNSKGLNPTTAKAWNDYIWSLVPNNIKFFYNSSLITTIGASGYHEVTVGILKYMIGLGFWHSVDIVNGMDDAITIEYRGMDKYLFDLDGGGATVAMTGWYSATITSGSTFSCGMFEPLEIRFDTDNLPSGENIGIVMQNGTTKYLFLN